MQVRASTAADLRLNGHDDPAPIPRSRTSSYHERKSYHAAAPGLNNANDDSRTNCVATGGKPTEKLKQTHGSQGLAGGSGGKCPFLASS